MNFILESLAFLQLAVVPGALLLKASKLRFGALGTPVACFAGSALVNYLFVLLAVACGVFSHEAALAFIGFEVVLGLWLWRASAGQLLRRDVLSAGSEAADKALKAIRKFVDGANCSKAFACAAFASALFALAVSVVSFFDNAGTIFDAWDAVLSWNRWATGWLAGSYPEWTNGYPQLVPANWALAYMIQGDTLQFVPKMTIGLYEIGMILALMDLAFLFRSAGIMAAVPLLSWLLKNIEISKFGGDVDLAITFMALAAFHCLCHAAKAEDAKEFKRLVVATSVLAAAAAASKQAGLFIFVMILPLGYALLRSKMREFKLGVPYRLKAFFVHLLLAALIAAPCYICAKYMVMQGRDKYKVKFVTEDIYGGRGYGERAVISSKMFLLRLELGMHEIPGARWCHVQMDKGFDGIQEFFKPYRTLAVSMALATLLLLILAGASSPLGLWPVLLVALPLTVIWALMYCYDLRNLTSALPFLAIGLGIGLERLSALCGSKLPALRGWALVAAAAGLLGALGLTAYDASSLRASHETLEMRIGDARLNAKLYAWHEKTPIKGRIATDYEFVNYLPGIKGSLCYQEFSGHGEKEWNLYLKAMEEPDLGYLLIPSYTMPRIKEDIARRESAGELTKIFSECNYTFFKIENRPQAAATDGSAVK